MKHISLFSGMGGFDLAAEWMGWENVAHCEWNPFGQRILKYYWPNAISYHDITKSDFTVHRGTIDILTGGFPCQPFSVAGEQRGTEDERHLWPEMLRAIREIQPRYIVGENVPGLINWNDGLVFEQVHTDLEAQGYEVIPFVLPAGAVDAPHRRDRVWFLAYACGNGLQRRASCDGQIKDTSQWSNLQQPCRGSCAQRLTSLPSRLPKQNPWGNFPTQSPVQHRNDGFPGKLDGISLSEWRIETIKAAGNAIVPQVAYQIFQAIQQFDDLCG